MQIENEDLAREVMQTIIDKPDRWDQNMWVYSSYGCETAYCFAGWALVLDGNSLEEDMSTILINGEPDDSTVGFTVPEIAKDLLGISEDAVADLLFDGANILDDLIEYLYNLTDGRVDFSAHSETHPLVTA